MERIPKSVLKLRHWEFKSGYSIYQTDPVPSVLADLQSVTRIKAHLQPHGLDTPMVCMNEV